MKQRFLLSLLSILALFYFALPHLQWHGSTGAALFTWVWIGFCVVAFGGNLAGLLYQPGKKQKKQTRKNPRNSWDRRFERGNSI